MRIIMKRYRNILRIFDRLDIEQTWARAARHYLRIEHMWKFNNLVVREDI